MSEQQHEHIVNPDGTAWCNRPDLHRRTPSEKERLAQTPGSIYYRAEPPDWDDFWRWCSQCQQWHRHAPCF